MSKFKVADLFAAAGGTSTGLVAALQEFGYSLDEIDLIAVNHDPIALATHELNHPFARHENSNLETVDPRKLVPGGKLDLMVASPECTHFSVARGGKPKNWQSRSTVKWVLRWINTLDIKDVLIENVKEFQTWGPLHRNCTCGIGKDDTVLHPKPCKYGKPIQSRKGQYFKQFIWKLKERGYIVKFRVILTANYGDPTSRERLFIIARKGIEPTYPRPTHSNKKQAGLKAWNTAKGVINIRNKGTSIFNRKNPLVPNTIRRIQEGLEKMGLSPFIIGQHSGSTPRGLNEPIPTLTGTAKVRLITPFLIDSANGGRVLDIKKPFPTLTSADTFSLVVPYIFDYKKNGGLRSSDEPLTTITSKNTFALITPIIKKDGKEYKLDIYHRMLTIDELKKVHFPSWYKLIGTREQKSKQIGNAVPWLTAKALCAEIISTRRKHESINNGIENTDLHRDQRKQKPEKYWQVSF